MTTFKRVIIESPYGTRPDGTRCTPDEIAVNVRYLRALMRYCVLQGWSPYASHALLTQDGVLRDDKPDERSLGIDAAFPWADVADFVVMGVDRGITSGMRYGNEKHEAAGRRVIEVSLPEWANGNVPAASPLSHAFRVIRTAVDTLESQMRMLLAERPEPKPDADALEVIAGHLQAKERAEARVRELEAEIAKMNGERVALPCSPEGMEVP